MCAQCEMVFCLIKDQNYYYCLSGVVVPTPYNMSLGVSCSSKTFCT